MIGMTHLSLENYEQSFSYFQKCVKISEQNNNMSDIIANTINMGMILGKQKKYQQALEIQLKTIQKAKKLNNEYEGYALSHIGNIYLAQNQFDSAIYYFTQSTDIGKKFNDLYLQAYALVRLGKAYQKQNQAEKALQYAEQGLVIANRMNLLTEKRDAYAILYEVYKNKTQYQKAMQYLELSKQANDSLISVEKTKSVANLENKMILEKKNQELILLTKDNEQGSFHRNIFIVISILALAIVFILFYNNRQKQNANQLLQEQKKQIQSQSIKLQFANYEVQAKNKALQTSEEELRQNMEELETNQEELKTKNEQLEDAFGKLNRQNQKVNDSIRYAQRIQNAVLPHQATLAKAFLEHFVIFKPKDVVSGDFYWYLEVENKKFLAIVDCTGHGVPGAFMSMIGNTLLYEIINTKRIFEPNLVLEQLHSGILNSLNSKDARIQDGMDIALCCIESGENGNVKIQFSGAKRPLYYFSKQELNEIQADRKSIGQSLSSQVNYTSNEVTLQVGDTLYMSTDGWIDSINPERKRFGSQQFKEMLFQGANLSLKVQEEVFRYILEDYEQGTEQRDDVLLVGVRV